MQARSSLTFQTLQIKNIKLHIVTDIKVNFNSMLGFRISLFGWGEGYFYILKKLILLQAISVCVAKISTRPSQLALLALLFLPFPLRLKTLDLWIVG